MRALTIMASLATVSVMLENGAAGGTKKSYAIRQVASLLIPIVIGIQVHCIWHSRPVYMQVVETFLSRPGLGNVVGNWYGHREQVAHYGEETPGDL